MVNMKNENADWKSELPDGWNIYPLKYFFSFGKGLLFSSAPKGEHVRLNTDRLSAPVRRTYPQES